MLQTTTFLMTASVRAYFKEHALESTDAVLFSIPSSVSDRIILEGAQRHPALPNFLYAVREEEEEDFIRLVRTRANKGLKWMILSYVVFSVFVVKFIVPPVYATMMTLLFIFFLCMLLILFL